MRVEIKPGLTEPVPTTIEALDETREQLLSYGFDECVLGLPTVDWHGVRVDLCADLAAEPGLPFIKPIDAENDKLVVGTLDAIHFDVDITDGATPDITVNNKYYKAFGHIALDQEIREDMTKLAELGNDLALQGFGYRNEREWIRLLKATGYDSTLGDTFTISARNGTRYNRLKRGFEAHKIERQKFWKQRDWHYFGGVQCVTLHRWLSHSPHEDSLGDRILVIECDENLKISGRMFGDFMPKSMQINITDVLTLEELAQLQIDTGFEFKSGVLSEGYKSLLKNYSHL